MTVTVDGKAYKEEHKEITDSTNNDAKKGRKEYVFYTASEQTAGRGRLGREFVSKKGGLYMSIFLKSPENGFCDIPFITTAAAVAVSRAVDKMTGKKTEIKWVNDIYLNNKKICGILCEGEAKNGKLECAVAGIGINLLKQFEFSGELNKKAGFVFFEGDFETLKTEFISKFAAEFYPLYKSRNKAEILKEYKEKNYLSGKTVKFYKEKTEQTGKVTGFDENLNLCVLTNEGEEKISFGEVIML